MITLFSARTGNGYRASILLEEMNLPYEVATIGFAPGDPRPEAFLSASPLAKIPAIIDHDTPDGRPVAVAESLAIALYLTEKTGLLLPSTSEGRARAAEWGAIVVSGFSAAISGIFFARRLDEQAGTQAHAGLIEKYHGDLNLAFAAMDARLSQADYLAGETYSYADVLAAPLPVTAAAFGVDLSPFPAILRWRDELLARPAVKPGHGCSGVTARPTPTRHAPN